MNRPEVHDGAAWSTSVTPGWDAPSTARHYASWSVVAHFPRARRPSRSLRASFERRCGQTEADPARHSLSWCLVDPEGLEVQRSVELDRAWLQGLEQDEVGATWMARSLQELRDKGSLPQPERRMVGGVTSRPQVPELAFGGHRLTWLADGTMRLCLGALQGEPVCELRFRPSTCAVQTQGPQWGDWRPPTRVEGWLMDGDRPAEVVGMALYEHRRTVLPPSTVPGLQLTVGFLDGSSVRLGASNGDGLQRVRLLHRDATDTVNEYTATLEATELWQSTQTYLRYPIAFLVRCEELGLHFKVRASLPDQELLTVATAPPSWSGRVDVVGVRDHYPVRGFGWLDQHHEAGNQDGRSFFVAVHEAVRKEVADLVGDPITGVDLAGLVGCTDRSELLDGIAPRSLFDTLLEPVLAIIDRGGKGWRSFTALACIDAVGGRSEHFRRWLAAPELIHVGSLIVDDVEDGSEVRRGGPTSHMLYGSPLAINAGSAAYFLAELALDKPAIPPQRAAMVHKEYFEAMRAGHAGQALDIANTEDLAKAAAESGEVEAIERWVMAINRLKTAVPAGTPARMGAIAGGGSAEQQRALGDYFESVALAFQVVDDVLNLRGFTGDTKQRGEDIAIGKITLPIVKAFGLLDPGGRAELWRILRTDDPDQALVERGIELVSDCGALQLCMNQARDLVEEAWKKLDPVVPDSSAKLRIRAAGWYLLERLV